MSGVVEQALADAPERVFHLLAQTGNPAPLGRLRVEIAVDMYEPVDGENAAIMAVVEYGYGPGIGRLHFALHVVDGIVDIDRQKLRDHQLGNGFAGNTPAERGQHILTPKHPDDLSILSHHHVTRSTP